jgi:hypothetical protein
MKRSAKKPSVPAIDLEDRRSVRYWTEELQVEEETLRDAVEAVGPAVERVRFHLSLRMAMQAGRPARRITPR